MGVARDDPLAGVEGGTQAPQRPLPMPRGREYRSCARCVARVVRRPQTGTFGSGWRSAFPLVRIRTVLAPPDADSTPSTQTWVGLSTDPVPVQAASEWVVTPQCGGIVVFNGTARDHSEGRPDVTVLEYEAYEEQVEPRLGAIADEARVRWPDLGRIAMIHRIGRVDIGESAVVVAVGAPHRDVAFAAARFCIDTLKASVPIWKREVWRDGESWGLEPQHVQDIGGNL